MCGCLFTASCEASLPSKSSAVGPDAGLVAVVLVGRQVASRSKGVLGIQAGYLSSVAAIELQERTVSVLCMDTCLPVPTMESTWFARYCLTEVSLPQPRRYRWSTPLGFGVVLHFLTGPFVWVLYMGQICGPAPPMHYN
ncbi:hypothetical protein AVEN_225223-1 [Araneus ventricosus]|uniref:Uncharacterized protein n=1 Tax=Araneus ventricosus TaxID=182803 RepID=A0A4Y2ANF2_ARAVE|nr:hypothetical protein AVEN_225223-1 [Araneus ventricosus]